MKCHASLALVLALAITVSAEVINIPKLGKVEGVTTSSSWSGRRIYEYRGIPYAEAPIGDIRFKDPVEKAPWAEAGTTFDATQFAQHCPQPGKTMLKGIGGFMHPDSTVQRRAARADAEDCLTLDVHTPTTNATAMLPVVVYFHGGAFIAGESSSLRPGFLLEKDIVLVTPQYRLGPLGYFYTNTPDSPGNMGLMDQRMALQWVRKYVKVFGGDPNKVTVAGSSSGGASASVQMLSPLFNQETDQLFSQVLATSASALSLYAMEVEHGEQLSRDMAEEAGCTQEDPAELMTCMRAKTAAELTSAFMRYNTKQRKLGLLGMGGAIPVVQRDENGIVPILTTSPQDLLESSDIMYNPLPMMVGATLHEGIYMLDAFHQGYLVPNDLVDNTQFMKTEIVPAILNAYGVDENSRVMADACVRRYFSRDDLGDFDKMIPSLIDFQGVTFIKGSIFRQAELHALKARTFLYSFDYYGEHTLFHKSEGGLDLSFGIDHADDTIYLFPSSDFPLNENDKAIAQTLVELYTNFIIYGHPTPEDHQVEGVPDFISYHREQGAYLSIDNTCRVRSNYRNSFTSAHVDGFKDRSAASDIASSVVLVLAAAAAILFH